MRWPVYSADTPFSHRADDVRDYNDGLSRGYLTRDPSGYPADATRDYNGGLSYGYHTCGFPGYHADTTPYFVNARGRTRRSRLEARRSFAQPACNPLRYFTGFI